MLLPQNRNRTYSGIVAVHSADLNDIQDCIIDAKQREMSYPHHAAHFQGSAAGSVFNGREQVPPAGGGSFYTPLSYVAVGGRLTQANFYYNRANAGTVTYGLIRTPFGGGATVILFSATDNATNGWATKNLVFNYQTLAGNSYALFIGFDAASAAAGSKLEAAVNFFDRL